MKSVGWGRLQTRPYVALVLAVHVRALDPPPACPVSELLWSPIGAAGPAATTATDQPRTRGTAAIE